MLLMDLDALLETWIFRVFGAMHHPETCHNEYYL